MPNPIQIKEYSEHIIDNCNLDNLQSFLRCRHLESALKITRQGIETKSWVGVIKYKNLHLEILPKLISENANNEDNVSEERDNILKNLIFMLSYTKNLDIKVNDDAKLSNEKNPFIEILIREFAKSLFDSLKRFTPKKYVREEENLNYLKGKIKFSENIRYNSANQAKFYCEYDEFSENNILNQLFLFVSACLYNLSNNSYNKKTLKFIMNYYSDIDLIRFDRFNVQKIKLSRNQELFKKPFNLAKMFIEQASIDLSKNRFENITLVWDMNKLFEEFIFEIIRKYNPNDKYKLTAQKGRKLLIGDTNKKRNTFVDIMLESKDRKIVLDTKYKKFANINDFSNSDVFQVSAYCLLHNARHAVLIYPQWGEDKLDNAYFLNTDNFDSEKYKIYFQTINLRRQSLKNNLETIRQEILDILEKVFEKDTNS